MALLLIAGGSIALDYACESWTDSVPSQVYSDWASGLGVSDTATLETLFDDDRGWPITLAAPFFASGPATGLFSSEAAVGFYRATPGSTTSYQYALSGVSRMFGLASCPTLLLAFHPSGGDLQSLTPTRIQRAGTTTILFGNFKHYSGSNTYRLDAAVKITPGGVEAVIRAIDAATDLRLFELDEFGAGATLSSTLVTTIAIGTMAHFTASLTTPRTDALLRSGSPLGSPLLLGTVEVSALLSAGSPLGATWYDGYGNFHGGELLYGAAFVDVNGLLSVGAPLGAAAALGGVDRAGVLALGSSALGAFSGRAYSDFGARLVPAPARYVMDVFVGGVAIRVPISTWQATVQLERACYVQCSIPACEAWVDTILAASEFRVSRVGRTVDGSAVEVEMARGPIENRSFDQGPRQFTATISGYSAGLATPDGTPGNGQTRALADVRSVSFGDGGMRARAAIDWMLRPGDSASAGGRVFRADYINYYVPVSGDAYMDAGERG